MVAHVKAQLRTSKGLTFGRDINLARQGLFLDVVSTVQHMAVVGRAVWSYDPPDVVQMGNKSCAMAMAVQMSTLFSKRPELQPKWVEQMSNPLPILAGEKRLLSASSTSTALLPRSCLFAFKAGGKSSRMVCCCASRLESVIPFAWKTMPARCTGALWMPLGCQQLSNTARWSGLQSSS